MALHIYNTFSRSIEEFKPLDPEGKRVTFYNCGPTVYGPFHVGNARNYVVADVLRHWLEASGYAVKFVQNITDVDDKIINKSIEEKTTADDVARRYTELFFEHAGRLGVRPADVHPKATEYIGGMIAMIQRLIDGGHAYASTDGSVWFRVGSFKGYGELSKKALDDLREGDRVDGEQQKLKESGADFCLWKSAKPGEPSWDSPWGKGRPGWHIECSCMATALLGDTIDIHMGGVDLVFPHHENERAQSMCATGKPFARYWVHNGFLNIKNEQTGEDEKMSKSLGNFFRIDEVLEQFDAMTIRHFLLSAHYRSPLTFSHDNLKSSRQAVQRILDGLRRAERILGPDGGVARDGTGAKTVEAAKCSIETGRKIESLRAEYAEAMNDDLNTSHALAVVFGTMVEMNRALDEAERASGAESAGKRADAQALRRFLIGELLAVLGLDPALAEKKEQGDTLVPALLDVLIGVRAEARKNKWFAIADKIRNDLTALDIALEDTPQGTVWKRTK